MRSNLQLHLLALGALFCATAAAGSQPVTREDIQRFEAPSAWARTQVTAFAGGATAPSVRVADDEFWASGLESPQAGGNGTNGIVWMLGVHRDMLIAGGEFTQAGDVVANRIAAFDGTRWSPMSDGFSARVFTMIEYRNELIVGGDFYATAGGRHLGYIARWDGSRWEDLSDGLSGSVRALAIWNGELVAGGDFHYAGALRVNQIARWNGQRWARFDGGFAGGYEGLGVRALEVIDHQLYAAGHFVMSYDNAVNYVARWDDHDNRWVRVGNGISAAGYALIEHRHDLVAGSVVWHNPSEGTWENVLSRWDGQQWSAMGFGPLDYPFPNAGRAFMTRGGQLIAAGQFPRAGGTVVNYLARWDEAQNAWEPFGSGLDSPAYAVTLYHGDLWVGGELQHAGGTPSSYIARWTGPAVGVTAADRLAARPSSSAVVLGWELPAREVSDFQSVAVERAVNSGAFARLATTQSVLTPAAMMKFVDPDMRSGATHRYRVVCTSWRGEQSVSEVVVVTLGNSRRLPDPPVLIEVEPEFIQFRLGEGSSSAPLRLDIFDVRGHLVRTIASPSQAGGASSLVWDRRSVDGARANRGVYFYTLDVGGAVYHNKLVMTR